MKLAIKHSAKKTAPGPDGRKLTDVAAIPRGVLVGLFNLWLYTGVCPTELCEGSTTLIPKEAGAVDPAKFRPITVSSVVLRLFHKIIAKRLEALCPVSLRQKAFRSGDGISENLFLLQSTILETTRPKRAKLLFICYVDVRKAFDSVSHQSLLAACRRAGIPETFVAYLGSFYSRRETTLQFGGEQSSRISCKQGVKQGDPLSPVLFNLVVDWCSEDLDPSIGFRWPEAICNYLAFADNLVLFVESCRDLQSQRDKLVTALGSCGLNINAAKCSSMAFDMYDRRSFVDSTPFLTASGETIPAMDRTQSYKYLGLPISSRGADSNVLPKLRSQLKNIDHAPLKPQQRLFILKQNVIPATYHQLVLGKVSKGLLKGLDCEIRKHLRKWLKLAHDSPNSSTRTQRMGALE